MPWHFFPIRQRKRSHGQKTRRYPFAQPDCFWADEDLRLSSGGVPQNANLANPIPYLGQPMLWFSWHLQSWNAARDDLMTWLTVVRQRLAQPV